jgi:malate dehydrogenase (oxaloacetate-decarboxylating)
VALALRDALMRAGLTAEEVRARLFVLDSKGLLIEGRPMEEYKRSLAQPAGVIPAVGQAPNLLETIVHARATVLLGLSGQAGAFGEAHARAMTDNTPRPVIFPLSNPTSACEAAPADLLRWSHDRAIVATGSPFDPVKDASGKRRPVGQGNNAFIFPGLGFGAILANASEVTEGMVVAASEALADYTATRHLKDELVYPPIDELQEVSLQVTTRVIAQAFADGAATTKKLTPGTAEAYARAHFWRPRYLPIVLGRPRQLLSSVG